MLTLDDILHATDAHVLQLGSKQFVNAVTSSSTAVGGSLFFALDGVERNGHDYVGAAFSAGATGAVVSRSGVAGWTGRTVVYVPDTLKALQLLAELVRRKYGPDVVAITGSVGKTTTKDMVAHALSTRFQVLKSKASYNNHLGVPLTLLDLREDHTHVVAEIGTNAPGEVRALAELVAPDVGVVTNVGLAHIGNFGSQDAIADEKLSLLDQVRAGGTCVINGDDKRLLAKRHELTERGRQVVLVGFSERNDVRADAVEYNADGTEGVLILGQKRYPFALRSTGAHFVYSCLFAVAVAQRYGIDVRSVLDALTTFQPPEGRSNIRRVEKSLIVDDSYNASPDSVLAALSLLEDLPGGHKVAVLGEMRELGQESTRLHQIIGRRVAEVASHLITVGVGGAVIGASAQERGLSAQKIFSASSAREALEQVAGILGESEEGGVVLVKGSRFTHMERVPLGLEGVQVKCALADCHLYIHCSTCSQVEVDGDGPDQEKAARRAAHLNREK